MINIRRFKSCITVKNGELTCPNPIIVFGKNKDILQNCEYKDGCIEVSILEEDFTKLKGLCIPYTVACENCGTCPVKDGEICFCDNNDDCTNCQNCISGICKDKCPDKICNDGECVDCTGNDCPTNQKCIDGKCKCPADKPYINADGVCYGCNSDTDCGPCYKCDGSGNCVPKDCGEGVCHPITGECQECIDNTKCKSNEVCKDGKCVCAPGYYLNPATGKCEPKPECFENSDCGDCENCIDKKCQPVVCPKGTKCVGDDCVDDPCESATCNDGTDCGEKCGCKDTTCTECSKLSCEECSAALGCVCNPSTGKCEKVKDCEDTCITKFDCSDGCGCDDGSCKNCANYSCDECASISGCKCTNGKCGDDGTEEGDCADTFVLDNKTCPKGELTATLKKDIPCNCSELDFEISNFKDGAKIKVTKSVANSLVSFADKTSVFISDKEDQVASSIELKISGSYNKDLDGVTEVVSFTKEITKVVSSFLTPTDIGSQISFDLEGFVSFNSATITYTHIGTIVNDNKCAYLKKIIYTNSTTSNFKYVGGYVSFEIPNTVIEHTRVSSSTTRKPLFVWYKSKTNVFDGASIIKRAYVDGTGTYVDKITYADKKLFETGYSYRVTNDCSCKKEALHIYNCEVGKFFETANLTYVVENCGKKITIQGVKACSDMHQDIPYQIVLDGAVKATADGANFDDGLEYTSTTGFKTLQLKAIKAGLVDCTKDYELPEQTPPDLVVTKTCVNGSTKFKIAKAGIEGIKDSEGINTYNPTGDFYEITSKTPLSIVVTYVGGCISEENLVPKDDCCEGLDITFSDGKTDKEAFFNTELEYTNTVFPLTTLPQGFTISTDKSYAQADGNGIKITNKFTNSTTINITVSDNKGCSKSLVLKVTKLQVGISIDSEKDCSNTVVRVTGEGGATFKVTSPCLSTAWEGLLSPEGKASLATTQTDGQKCTYKLETYKGIELVTKPTVNFDKSPVPSVTNINVIPNIGICGIGGQPSSVKLQIVSTLSTTSTDLAGLIATYTIGNSSDIDTPIVTGTTLPPHIVIPLTSQTPCGQNVTITVKKLSSSAICFTPVTITKNFNLPCISDIPTTPVCFEGVQYLEVPTPTNVISVGLQHTTPGIPTNVVTSSTFTLDSFNNIRKFLVPLKIGSRNIVGPYKLNLNTDTADITYCTRDIPTFEMPNCSKIPLTVSNQITACITDDLILRFSPNRILINGLETGSDLTLERKNRFQLSIVKLGGISTPLQNNQYSFDEITREIVLNDFQFTNFQESGTYSISVSYDATMDTKYTMSAGQSVSLSLGRAPNITNSPLRLVFGKALGSLYYKNFELGQDKHPTLLGGNVTVSLSTRDLALDGSLNIIKFFHVNGEAVRDVTVRQTAGPTGLSGNTNFETVLLDSSGTIVPDPFGSNNFTSAVGFPTVVGTHEYKVSYKTANRECPTQEVTLTIIVEQPESSNNILLLPCLTSGYEEVGAAGVFVPYLVYKINGNCYIATEESIGTPTIFGYDEEHNSCTACNIELCGCGSYNDGDRTCMCESRDSECIEFGQGVGCQSGELGGPCVCA